MNSKTMLAILVAVLCNFVMSSMVSQIGVVTAPMADHFGRKLTEIVPLFSFLTGGSFVGIFISLAIFNYLPIRQVILLCSALILSAVSVIYLIDNILLIPLSFAVMGVAGGVGMSAAAVTISNTFDAKRRASMLVCADLFYSAGGYFIVSLVSFMVAAGVIWNSGYLAVASVSIIVFCLALIATFPEVSESSHEADNQQSKERWSLNVYLVGAAMLVYMLGQNAFVVWAPTYLSESFAVGVEEAGSAVSNYWGAGVFGLIISALVLRRIKTSTFVVAVTASAALLTFVLFFTENEVVFKITSALLGLVSIGSFGSMISLGVEQQRVPSVSLVPFLLCCASSGAMLSPMVSSYFVGVNDIGIAMTMVFSAYLTVFFILSCVTLITGRGSAEKMPLQRESL